MSILILNLPAAPARYTQIQSILLNDHRQIGRPPRPSLSSASMAYFRRRQLSRDEAPSLSLSSSSPHAVRTLEAPSPCSDPGKVDRNPGLVGGEQREATTGVSISTAETLPLATVLGGETSVGGAAGEAPEDYVAAMIGAKEIKMWHSRPNTAGNSSLSNRDKNPSVTERREMSSAVPPSSCLVDYSVTTTSHDQRTVEAPGKRPLDEVNHLSDDSSPWTTHSIRMWSDAQACKQTEKHPLSPPDWPSPLPTVNNATGSTRRNEEPMPSTVKMMSSMQKIVSPSPPGSVRGVGTISIIPSNDESTPHCLREVKASERRTLGIVQCSERMKRNETDQKHTCGTTSWMTDQHRLQQRFYTKPSRCSFFQKKAFSGMMRGTCLKTPGIAINPSRAPAEIGCLDWDGIHKDMIKHSGEKNGSASEDSGHGGGGVRQTRRIPCNGYLLYVRDLCEDPVDTRITWTPRADKGDSMANCGMSVVTNSLNSTVAPSTPFIRCRLVGISPWRFDIIILLRVLGAMFCKELCGVVRFP